MSRRSNNNQLETDSVETNALRKPTNTSSASNHHQFTANHVPSGSSQFLNCWQQSDVQSRLGLLLKIGPVGLVQIFSIDMPTALLGEIFEALHGFEPTVEGIGACVVGVVVGEYVGWVGFNVGVDVGTSFFLM